MTRAEFETMLNVIRPRLARSLINKYGEEGEDALQEALLRAYSKLDTYDHSVNISTWIYTIAYHIMNSRHKRNRRLCIDQDVDVDSLTELPSQELLVELQEWESSLSEWEKDTLLNGDHRQAFYQARKKYES